MCVRAEVVVLSAGLQFYLTINDITNLVFNCPVNLLLATIFKAILLIFDWFFFELIRHSYDFVYFVIAIIYLFSTFHL